MTHCGRRRDNVVETGIYFDATRNPHIVRQWWHGSGTHHIRCLCSPHCSHLNICRPGLGTDYKMYKPARTAGSPNLQKKNCTYSASFEQTLWSPGSATRGNAHPERKLQACSHPRWEWPHRQSVCTKEVPCFMIAWERTAKMTMSE